MADTPPTQTDALIHCTHPGCLTTAGCRGSCHYERAALPPTIGADDEALIARHRNTLFYLNRMPKDALYDLKVRLETEVDAAEEALRRHIAGLRAEIADWEIDHTKIGTQEAIERRAEAVERELAEVRDKVIEECVGAVFDAIGGTEEANAAAAAIRALKKEPTNG